MEDCRISSLPSVYFSSSRDKPQVWDFIFHWKVMVSQELRFCNFFSLFQCATSSLCYLETEEAVLICRVSLLSCCASTLNFLCPCRYLILSMLPWAVLWVFWQFCLFCKLCGISLICLGHRDGKIYFYNDIFYNFFHSLLLLSNCFIFLLSVFVFIFYWFSFIIFPFLFFPFFPFFPCILF